MRTPLAMIRGMGRRVVGELTAQNFGPLPEGARSFMTGVSRPDGTRVEIDGYILNGESGLCRTPHRFESRPAPFGAPPQVVGHFGVHVPVRLTAAEIAEAKQSILAKHLHREAHTYAAWVAGGHRAHGGARTSGSWGDMTGGYTKFSCGCGEEFTGPWGMNWEAGTYYQRGQDPFELATKHLKARSAIAGGSMLPASAARTD